MAVSEGWHPKVGDVLERRWEIVKKLGQGAFGAVYEVQDKNDNSKPAACKVEHVGAAIHILIWEVLVMKQLTQAKATHTTQFLDCGRGPRGDYAFMVMTMVGANLEKLREKLPPNAGGRFSLRTCLHIGMETLIGMRELHDSGYLHRDVKPENFCIGRPPATRGVYVLDLGMVRQYRRPDGKIHTPRKQAAFRGNLKYASIFALKQEEQARRDDLWAWFYMIIELTVGKLPWVDWVDAEDVLGQLNAFAANKQKVHADPATLTNSAPREFAEITDHLNTLNYYSDPNYDLIVGALKKTSNRKGYTDEVKLDWEDGGQYYEQTRMVPYDNRCRKKRIRNLNCKDRNVIDSYFRLRQIVRIFVSNSSYAMYVTLCLD